MSRKTPFILLVALAAACASSGTAPGSAASVAPKPARRNPDVISHDELTDPHLKTLSVFDVIKALRPNFLLMRGTQTVVNGFNDAASGRVHASLDYAGLIEIDELKLLPLEVVLDIRLLGVGAAMQQFGSDANQGPVIVVRTMAAGPE